MKIQQGPRPIYEVRKAVASRPIPYKEMRLVSRSDICISLYEITSRFAILMSSARLAILLSSARLAILMSSARLAMLMPSAQFAILMPPAQLA